jgi:hypothetical protein
MRQPVTGASQKFKETDMRHSKPIAQPTKLGTDLKGDSSAAGSGSTDTVKGARFNTAPKAAPASSLAKSASVGRQREFWEREEDLARPAAEVDKTNETDTSAASGGESSAVHDIVTWTPSGHPTGENAIQLAQASAGAAGTVDTLPGAQFNLATLFGGVAVAGLIAGGTGGSKSAGVAARPTTIELINGYIRNAKVWQDNNRNGVIDADEPQGTTNAQGKVELFVDPNGGPLRSSGGIDLSLPTGSEVSNSFMSPAGATVISPLTTLVSAMTSTGVSKEDALASVIKSFGLEGANLLTLDPIEAALNGTAPASLALKVKAAAVSVANLMDAGESILAGAGVTGDASLTVAASLAKQLKDGTVVDLTKADDIKSVLSTTLQGVNLADEARGRVDAALNAAATVTASVNDIAAQAASSGDPDQALAIIAAVQAVAQGEASAQIQKVISGEISAQAIVNEFTGDRLAQQASELSASREISPGVFSKAIDVLPTDSVIPPVGSGLSGGQVTAKASLTKLGESVVAAGEITELLASFSIPPQELLPGDFQLSAGLSLVSITPKTDHQYLIKIKAEAGAVGEFSAQLKDGWLNEDTPGDMVSFVVMGGFDRIDFSEPSAQVKAFEGALASIASLSDGNEVLRISKPTGAKPYGGVTVALNDAGLVGAIPVTEQSAVLSVWVYAPEAGVPIRMQLANSDAGQVRRYLLDSEDFIRDDRNFVEAEVLTTTSGWQELAFDFNQPTKRFVSVYGDPPILVSLKPGVRYDQINLFPDFDNRADGTVYYFDGLSMGTNRTSKPIDPVPSDGGPDDNDSVIFSQLDFETLPLGTEFPKWDGAYASVVADPTDAGNKVAQYVEVPTARTYAGVTLGSEGTDFVVGRIPFEVAAGKTAISARVWSDEVGVGRTVRMQVADSKATNDTGYVEAEAVITQSGWRLSHH